MRETARWVADNIISLRNADPETPEGLHDRAADNWRALFAIADQRATVTSFVGSDVIMAEFVEVESGRNADRPELEKAIQFAKMCRATLIVAKVDRLTRDVKRILRERVEGEAV